MELAQGRKSDRESCVYPRHLFNIVFILYQFQHKVCVHSTRRDL
jgi:hypothetical protein